MVQPSILKSHKHSKLIETYFLSFILHNDWLQNHYVLSVKSMTLNCAVVVSVLLPISCHIGSGMPYQCVFVEEVVALLGALNEKWV